MRATLPILLAAGIVAVVSTAGCSAPGPPTYPAGIEGIITSVAPGEADTLATILVEVPEGAVADPSFVSDKASVRITRKTRVFDLGGNPVDAASIAVPDLAVRVWFEGAVAESYPVQGTASAVQQAP